MPRATQETTRSSRVFGYAPLTLYGVIFHSLHLTSDVPHYGPTTPGDKSPGLACSRFARHYSGNQFLFLFLRILRCFTSPRLTLPVLWIQTGVRRLPGVGCPIRKSPDQSVLAAPRGLSQLATSFVVFWCQGIHQLLLVA